MNNFSFVKFRNKKGSSDPERAFDWQKRLLFGRFVRHNFTVQRIFFNFGAVIQIIKDFGDFLLGQHAFNLLAQIF